jgi:hypothetical protein
MFRFTIRDLLWLMVVVGLAVGWSLDDSLLRREQRRLSVDLAKNKRELARVVWMTEYLRKKLAPANERKINHE